MPALTIDGQAIAEEIRAETRDAVARHVAAGGRRPGLAAVLVGDNPASEKYVRNKRKACEQAGIGSWLHRLPAAASEQQLLDLVGHLNSDPAVSGVLVQLPLPRQIDEAAVIRSVSPVKDVDCFHPENVGLLAAGHPRFLPCTPLGVRVMLSRTGIPTAGKHAVVVGRSNIVGKPMALILMQKPSAAFPDAADATVTVVHRGTTDLRAVTRQADILVVAAGSPRFLTGDMVKPGAAVLDVGIHVLDGKTVGDVDAASVAPVAGWLSPVPKGVGPMTVTMLLHNTLKAAMMG